MLKRLSLIQSVGKFRQARGGGAEFGPVTVVFGENRCGKSTLCDVLQSLSCNDPSFILNRQSIPGDINQPAQVELQFDTATAAGPVTSTFQNGVWQNATPIDTALFVFDQSFIHRNVLTGTKPERQNSENATEFILGEQGAALYRNLEQENTNLRTDRANLATIGKQLNSHVTTSAAIFANTALPAQSKGALTQLGTDLELRKKETDTIIANNALIRNRPVLSSYGVTIDVDPHVQSANELLSRSVANVHEGAKKLVDDHVSRHVANPEPFNGWANQGLTHGKSNNCPFCSQVLSTEATNLINAYQTAFDDEFDRVIAQIRRDIEDRRGFFEAPISAAQLQQMHTSNLTVFQLYTESALTQNQALQTLLADLDTSATECRQRVSIVSPLLQALAEQWRDKLAEKTTIPYTPLAPLDGVQAIQAAATLRASIIRYDDLVQQINDILDGFKTSIDTTQLEQTSAAIGVDISNSHAAIQRIDLEPICQQYRDLQAIIAASETAYAQNKEALENSQTAYLGQYFGKFNALYARLGSSEFDVSRVANNRGTRIIYELQVKFRGQLIRPEQLNCVFSESDRRAFALCLFLARIDSLPTAERSNAVVVMDDPVTSFDRERIMMILNKLDELSREIKQLVVTTHYKGMASDAIKKFGIRARAIVLGTNGQDCTISLVNNDVMTATDHDIAYDRIKGCADRAHNLDIMNELRPFLETEVRHRYKRQLALLGMTKQQFKTALDALKDNGHIGHALWARLDAFRTSLNPAMHTLGAGALDNTRNAAQDVLDVVYNELVAAP